MNKIYSRPRIKLPNIFISNLNKKNRKNVNKVIRVFFILIFTFVTFNIILNAVLPIFNTLCEDKAKSIATLISNEQATVVMREHTYDELFTIEKDSSGNINMIKSNVSPINEIISDIAIKIQNEINNKGKDNVKISLGSFTGFKLLSGQGPAIKIKISSIGNVQTDLRSEFTAQGINQTLHRVYLEVKCEVSVLTPFENITTNITNQVLLAENVIIGNIPNTYYNLEGLDQKNMIDIIQ